jgi:hypothetical protein
MSQQVSLRTIWEKRLALEGLDSSRHPDYAHHRQGLNKRERVAPAEM